MIAITDLSDIIIMSEGEETRADNNLILEGEYYETH